MKTLDDLRTVLQAAGWDDESIRMACLGYKFARSTATQETRRRTRWQTAAQSCRECGTEFRLTSAKDAGRKYCYEICRITHLNRKARETRQRTRKDA